MSWIELTPATCKEAALQSLFDHWRDPERQSRVVGAPAWIQEAMGRNERIPRQGFDTGLGYTFHPDVVTVSPSGPTGWVIELKYGEKYEPLVLAQALFEAEWLEKEWNDNIGGREVTHMRAGLVAQYNLMSRGAVRRLRKRGGLSNELFYAEVSIYEVPPALETTEAEDADARLLFWFDAPFSSSWASAPPPAEVAAAFAADYWYHAVDSDSWFGFDSPQESGRPLFYDGRWVQVAATQRGVIAWEGTATTTTRTAFHPRSAA